MEIKTKDLAKQALNTLKLLADLETPLLGFSGV